MAKKQPKVKEITPAAPDLVPPETTVPVAPVPPETPPAAPAEPVDERPTTLGTEQRELPVRLTLEELADRAQQMGEAEQAASTAESEAKAAKQRQKDAEDRRATLAETCRHRQELRMVECVLCPDWDKGVVEIVREDTGETVATRALYDDERQLELPLAEPPAPAAVLTEVAAAFNAAEAAQAQSEGRPVEAHAEVRT